MGLLAFIIIGLIAGFIARALMPGDQHMGLGATTLLGMAGSIVGGLIGSLLRSEGSYWEVHPSGILLSIVGSLILLLVFSLGRRERLRV